MRIRQLARAVAFGLVLGAATTAAAIDWSQHADEGVVQVVTHDEDGSARTTKIWLVVVGGEAYIRTGGTRWGKNAQRDPDVRLLTAAGEYDLRVEPVTDEATRAAVSRAFRDKYGWSDRLVSPFRGSTPAILRLAPRAGE